MKTNNNMSEHTPRQEVTANDPWLTLDEAASRVKLHPQTIRRAARAGRIRSVRVNNGTVYRFRASWCDQYLLGEDEHAA